MAMIALASNSLLCRAALKQTDIDAATFTFTRIFSGAMTLWLLMHVRRKTAANRTASILVENVSSSLPTTPLLAFLVAVTGLLVFVLPGLSAPPLAGSLLMLRPGVASAIYSIRGK